MSNSFTFATAGVLAITLTLGLAWSVAAQETNTAIEASADVTANTEIISTEADETESSDTDNEVADENQDRRNESERPVNRIETAAERQAAIEARRLEFQATRADRQVALQERAQQRVLNLAANISNRMEAAIRRLDNVVMRLSQRVDILAARGVATSDAEAELATAQAELDRARTTLATIDADVIAFVSSENPRANWAQVRTTYATARDAIKAAYTSIRTSIRLLQSAIATPPATTPDAAVDTDTEVEATSTNE